MPCRSGGRRIWSARPILPARALNFASRAPNFAGVVTDVPGAIGRLGQNRTATPAASRMPQRRETFLPTPVGVADEFLFSRWIAS